MTAARTNAQIAESLATLTHILARGDNPARDGQKRLERFLKHKPSFFVGGFNPDGAGGSQPMVEGGVVITWEMFKREFFNKYFPADVKNKKVVEFIKLEQGNMSVAKYAAMFDSLCAFSPHYNTPEAENDKCVKLEFVTKMGKLRETTSRRLEERGNTVPSLMRLRENEVLEVEKERRRKEGHRSKECKATTPTCFNCGEEGHKSPECKKPNKTTRKVFSLNGEGVNQVDNLIREGHKSPECKKPNKTTRKVFSLNGEGVNQVDNLIRGMCFIHDTPLIAIIDTGATHSFISMDCMKRLNIPVYEMSGCMNIETPASGSVTTRLVCRNCPVTVFGRHFGMDLVCIPLSGIDVIFGMSWLVFNQVNINCCEKTVIFPKSEVSLSLMNGEEVKESLNDHGELFMVFGSLKFEDGAKLEEIPVVSEFSDVFPEDISDLPPEREVEFGIDLVPGTSPISMAPYRMSASELNELKKQLEELLKKKFMRIQRYIKSTFNLDSDETYGSLNLYTLKEFRSYNMFRSYRQVMSYSEDEDVQKLNYEGLSEAIHSRPIRLQVIRGSSEAKEFPKSSEGLHQQLLSSLMICSKDN
ncbi:hypothetical protein TSUD_401310 [Trifolium subterraneum]|uniref:CCHC-type domain-containing protein n=1 Tax=Trifolium subterraneum TaxID=3900 RepID=A0A2Z6PJ02_TRISU|nr:hypothetical protein TSUD_401310 [Trifolium subterraneum]